MVCLSLFSHCFNVSTLGSQILQSAVERHTNEVAKAIALLYIVFIPIPLQASVDCDVWWLKNVLD